MVYNDRKHFPYFCQVMHIVLDIVMRESLGEQEMLWEHEPNYRRVFPQFFFFLNSHKFSQDS